VVAAAPPDVELALAVLAPFADAHPDLAAALHCEVLGLDGRDKARRVLAEQTWLARAARRCGATVVHHAGGIVPFVHPGRVVLTLHDLQPLDLPANFSVAKRTYVRAMAARSVAAAEVTCVPSEFTRGRTLDLVGADPDRVRVVPWSVPPPPELHDDVALPAGVPGPGEGPVVLYPAITYAHKGHLTLLEAIARVVRDEPELTLVLPGGAGPLEPEVRARMSRPDLAGRVVRTGRVAAPQLEALYRRADLVCVPSRYEGFGLPVLEAMVRGVPVLAADAGALPEVARAEDLVPVDDVAAWAGAVSAVLRAGPGPRRDGVAEARRRAGTFTAGRTAGALLDAYRTAAGGDAGGTDPSSHGRSGHR
jgi:alpha-1,3-rhamnosyl/mannosyltransferase